MMDVRGDSTVLAPRERLTLALGDVQRIAFDLDGTLYDTRDFERPALASVAHWLRETSRPRRSAEMSLRPGWI